MVWWRYWWKLRAVSYPHPKHWPFDMQPSNVAWNNKKGPLVLSVIYDYVVMLPWQVCNKSILKPKLFSGSGFLHLTNLKHANTYLENTCRLVCCIWVQSIWGPYHKMFTEVWRETHWASCCLSHNPPQIKSLFCRLQASFCTYVSSRDKQVPSL